MKFRLLFLTILTIYSHLANAQLFDSGQNPPGIKFRQIHTKNFQIIYPTDLETEAQRMAATLEHILPAVSKSLGREPRKISVILQNQGTESNGFVQLAPRRSEFYTTAPQTSDYQDWLSGLAVHELRHVVQFDRLAGEMRRPFFEELALAFFGITLPPWFYEGDAVVTETTLTNGGRGVLPSFEMQLRTNTLSLQKYSYSKNYLGSVKDNTPGYYPLGYFMTAKLRRDHGSQVLDSIYARIRKNPFRPYNLSRSIKHFTGLTTRQLHDATVSELEKLWKDQFAKIEREVYPPINKRENEYPLDYWLPTAFSPSEILALKDGRDSPPAIVKIDSTGREEKIVKIGFQQDPHFHFSNNKIVWDESRFDARFKKRSYSVINVLDLATGKRKQLTHKTRYFAPVLSPDGTRIAAVFISYKNEISLVEIDSKTGQELRRFPSPQNMMLQTPSYHDSGQKLVVVAVRNGAAIYELNTGTGIYTEKLPLLTQQISRPVYVKDNIAFKAHFSGVDNIYLLDEGKPIPRQLSFAEFGAFNPSHDVYHDRVLFNNFQSKGFDISGVQLEQADSIRVENTFINFAAPIKEAEGSRDVFARVPERHYPSKPFRELSNLFYFHTLSAVVEENSNDDYNIGLNLRSNNKLNTLDLSMGYKFNNALQASEYRVEFDYKKFFPVINLSYQNLPRLIYQRRQTPGGAMNLPVTWRENISELNVTIPVSFNQFNHNFGASFLVGTSYTSRYQVTNRPRTFLDNIQFPLRYSLNLSHTLLRSAMELAPRFGQSIALTYRHFPLDNKFSGHLFILKSRLYFPGLFKLHSLQAGFNYQTNSGTYNSTIDIPHIRGYSHLPVTRNLHNNLQLDYRLPLFYPDLELGPLAYLKRVRGGLFADYENIGKGSGLSPRSFGVSAQGDFNLLRFYLPNFAVGTALIFSTEKSVQNPIFDLSFSYTY